MRKHTYLLAVLVVVFALVAVACSGSSDVGKPPTLETSTATTAPASPDPATTAGDSPTEPPIAEPDAADFEDTFVTFGNPDAEAVIVVAQGGPLPMLDTPEAESLFADFDLDEVQIVMPHQAQTLDPERFMTEEITFDQAKEFDTVSTQLLGDVVQYHLDQGRTVGVVGISFGAFVVQDLLASQGNIADGYLIQVGRLDMPAAVWEPFSQGRFVGFVDGVEVVDIDADGAGMGGDTAVVDANMAKLAAGLGHKRYTELLADVGLDNVVYAYGEADEQVGRLTADELAFLEAKGVELLVTGGGHGETVDDTLLPGLELVFGGQDDDATAADQNEDIGYLPAEQVAGYVAAYEQGLAASSVTIAGAKLDIDYVGFASEITVLVDGGAIAIALGDGGIEGVQVSWEEREWLAEQEPDVTATPEALGGEGTMLSMALTAVSAEDPTETIDVEVDLDVTLIGMGASVVEAVDGYATVSGTLGTSTYVQLATVMADNPEIDTLVMVNVNGSENDEINVHTARLIRDAGWTTWVPANGDISSGGVDMFVAGVTRIVEPGGFVGVHSWGSEPGEPTGRDYPRDSPAHRSQLEYFTEMMGDEAGTDFYFYTLEAAPFDQIYRMTSAEIADYGLATDDAPLVLSVEVTGPPAGYLELAEGSYLKLQVVACSLSAAGVTAELISSDLGPVEVTSTTSDSEMSFPALEGLAPVDHVVTDIAVADGVLSGVVDLDFQALTGDLDTSNADFSVPCAG